MPINQIPKKAKRVFKGVLLDVYHWQQKLYDGSKATFELARRQDIVLVIPTMNGKIGIVKQKQPPHDWFWSVPGGRMDVRGESAKQTALRELLEETGLKPKSIKLWKVYRSYGKMVMNIHVFVARDCIKVAKQNLDAGEKIEVKYLTFEQFLKLTDNSAFYEGELMIDMLRARLHPKKKRELKKAIFG